MSQSVTGIICGVNVVNHAKRTFIRAAPSAGCQLRSPCLGREQVVRRFSTSAPSFFRSASLHAKQNLVARVCSVDRVVSVKQPTYDVHNCFHLHCLSLIGNEWCNKKLETCCLVCGTPAEPQMWQGKLRGGAPGGSRTTPGGPQNHRRKPWRKMLWKTQWKFCKESKLCLSTFSTFFSQTFFATFFAHFFATFFTIFCRTFFTYGVAEARPCYGLVQIQYSQQPL